jgi:hypothetical protein
MTLAEFLSARQHRQWLYSNAWRLLVVADAHCIMARYNNMRDVALHPALVTWKRAYSSARRMARFA